MRAGRSDSLRTERYLLRRAKGLWQVIVTVLLFLHLMPKLTLDEIKAKADEYAKAAAAIGRAEKARDAALAPIVERHAEEMRPVLDKHDPKIAKLYEKAARLEHEVVTWVGARKRSYKAESELATFGIDVGTKDLERQPDKQKLWNLCKKKGVEFFDLVNVMLAEADKRLGKKEVDALSTRRTVPTSKPFLKVK